MEDVAQRFPNRMVVHLNAIRKPSSFAAQNGVIVEARMSIVTVQIALITERVQKVFYIRFLFPFTLVCMFQYKKIFS